METQTHNSGYNDAFLDNRKRIAPLLSVFNKEAYTHLPGRTP